MTRIGLLSDTHSYLDKRFFELFKEVDEIWHAGDIGDIRVLDELRNFKLTRAVFGNIDDAVLRKELNEHERFTCENLDVWITHIGGYPGKYDWRVQKELQQKPPGLFIAGHSHILKVIFDEKLQLLHMNPGAAGVSGFHAVRTALRFSIEGQAVKDLEVIELGPKKI